jgi:ABC-type Fe3+/spermidine/putrescine transport system ATPase subunit
VGGEGVVLVEGMPWRLGRSGSGRAHQPAGARVRLLVRPEALRFAERGTAGIPVTVIDRRFAGSGTYYTVRTRSATMVEVNAEPDAAVVGAEAALVPAADPADAASLVRCFDEAGG